MVDEDEPRLVFSLTSSSLHPREATMADEDAVEALVPADSLSERDLS